MMTDRVLAWVEYYCPLITAAAQAAAFGHLAVAQL